MNNKKGRETSRAAKINLVLLPLISAENWYQKKGEGLGDPGKADGSPQKMQYERKKPIQVSSHPNEPRALCNARTTEAQNDSLKNKQKKNVRLPDDAVPWGD